MTKLEKFIQKWSKKEIEDHGGVTSPDYKQFEKEFKAVLKEIGTEVGMKLHKFNPNHYCCTAVMQHEETGNFYYVSISDVRHFSKEWKDHVLYRTMSHDKDWSGGNNNYSNLQDLGKGLQRLEEHTERKKAAAQAKNSVGDSLQNDQSLKQGLENKNHEEAIKNTESEMNNMARAKKQTQTTVVENEQKDVIDLEYREKTEENTMTTKDKDVIDAATGKPEDALDDVSDDLKEDQDVAKAASFDGGKRIGIQFSRQQVISERMVDLTRFDPTTKSRVPVLDADNKQRKVKESRIKLPASSQYKDYVLTTKENVFVPHKFEYDKETKTNVDKGASQTMLMVKLFENAEYKLTKTPYLMNEDNTIKTDGNGKKQLDFEKQEVAKLTGTDLKKEFDSWKTQNREQSALDDMKSKGTSSEKTGDEPAKNKEQDR